MGPLPKIGSYNLERSYNKAPYDDNYSKAKKLNKISKGII